MKGKPLQAITNALTICGNLTNVHSGPGEEPEVFVQGRHVDAYSLLSVLAMRIAAGDIELDIREVGDTCHKKKFYDKLCESCAKIEIPSSGT